VLESERRYFHQVGAHHSVRPTQSSMRQTCERQDVVSPVTLYLKAAARAPAGTRQFLWQLDARELATRSLQTLLVACIFGPGCLQAVQCFP